MRTSLSVSAPESKLQPAGAAWFIGKPAPGFQRRANHRAGAQSISAGPTSAFESEGQGKRSWCLGQGPPTAPPGRWLAAGPTALVCRREGHGTIGKGKGLAGQSHRNVGSGVPKPSPKGVTWDVPVPSHKP